MIQGNEQRRMVAYLDGFDLTPVPSPKGDGCLLAMERSLPFRRHRTRSEAEW